MTTPLDGLLVVDLSTTTAGAQATQFLADAGAEVVHVEPRGGSPLRAQAAWPALARGTRSVVLDLNGDRAELDALIARADVLVTTFRPATAQRLGFTADALAALNPRLVSAAITGWGSTGPWADLKGYEGMVMAKLGVFHTKRRMVTRDGPAFVSVPYASWGASQAAVHGILGSLLDRERTGLGQHVEADLVRGVTTLDTWNWFTEMIGLRWPGAYEVVDAFTDDGEPQGATIYALLVAPTQDGHWLQFAQLEPRLFVGMMQELGLAELLTDPKWKGLPSLDSQELRSELWERMLERAHERTLAEWEQVFATNPHVSAEIYRSGPEALAHPQLQHDGRVAEVEDPELGIVRQPSTLVHCDGKPLSPARPAPRLGEHSAATVTGSTPTTPVVDAAPTLPLAGVTIVEFGVMFAGPYGSTLLADLGARVIKVEPLAGDSMRRVLPFPDAGAAKAMQGKESIALDLGSADGLAIVHELVAHADVVLQSFRAGAAERAGVDRATLIALNPDLIYVNAPGYGTDGPYGKRPAYAPSIGSAVGLALTDAPDARGAAHSLAEIKQTSLRLNQAVAVPSMQADGVAALAVASTMLLGLLARARGRALGELTATMLGTGTHALLDRVVDYSGRPASPTTDADVVGFSALYRMYPAADGWVFLAAPKAKEWPELVAALAALTDLDLAADPRFATPELRGGHDAELAQALAAVLRTRRKLDWESSLTAAGVGCVEVTEITPELLLQTDEELGAVYGAPAVGPMFDEYLRLGPLVRFSRSLTQCKGGCSAGEQTDAILRELGRDDDAVADLHARRVVN